MNNCTIDRNDLLSALDAVKGAIAQKTFQPILTHVLIDNEYVYGFDSEIGIRYKLPKPVGITFNVRFDTIYNLVRALAGDIVSFELEGLQNVRVKCGTHASKLMQISDKFPMPPSQSDGLQFHPVSTGFRDALERCLVAASDNDTEKVLSSVLVKGEKVYGTDRARIVRCTLDKEAALPSMLLSRKCATELVRLGQPGKVAIEGGWCIWDYGNLFFIAALREGMNDFPDVDTLLENNLELPAIEAMQKLPDGFAACITRLSLFCSKEDRRVTTRESVLAFELVARAENGEAVEHLEKFENPPRGKGFNPDKLQEALKYASHIHWGASHADPIYIRGTDCAFEFLLSPMMGS